MKTKGNPLNPTPDESPMNRDRRDVPLVRGTYGTATSTCGRGIPAPILVGRTGQAGFKTGA